MKNKILLVIVIILFVIFLKISSSQKTTIFYSEPIIRVKDNNDIINMQLEEYIIGVVAAEMPASFSDEALKAQAVAARTYAIYKMMNANKNYDIITSVTNQSYININEMKNKWNESFNKYYTKIVKSVEETKGQVMKYNGNIVKAYYFSMSNGYTEDSKYVFNETETYLKSVNSSYDKNNKNFTVTKTINKKELCNILNIECNSFVISEIDRSPSNRVNYIIINNSKYKGTEIRKKLNLRSTDFIIDIDGENIKITTKGYGHGVGMSQYGANGMAKDGYSYIEILKHYYSGVEITSI